jgi:hypothetical protein
MKDRFGCFSSPSMPQPFLNIQNWRVLGFCM